MEEVYGIFSPVMGVKEDIPSILLTEGYVATELPDTQDVMFNNGEIQSVRKRLKAWTDQLPDRVLHVKQAKKRDGTVYDIYGTKRDLAFRDHSNERYQFINPRYNTGKVRLENASDKVYGGLEVDNCDTDPVAWADGSGGDVTPSRNTTSPKDGTAFVRLTVVAGAGVELLAYHNITSIDLSAYDSIGFWIRSSVATDEGDFQFLIDDTNGCGSPLETLDIPALTANTWTWVNLTLSDPSLLTAVLSIGVQQAVDKGACTIDIDQVVVGDWAGQLKAGDFITIGSTYTTDDTWYEIETVDSDTQVTLTSVYAGVTASQQSYLARVTYVGTNLDYWRSIVFNNKWIGTNNGKDYLQVWDLDSTTRATNLTELFKAKFIAEFENYVLVADITDGAGDRYPQKYQWCSLGDETAWASGDAGESNIQGEDFINGIAQGEINGFKIIGTQRALYRLHLVSGDEVFQREIITKDIGIAAPDSMINQDHSVYAWCSDGTFRRITLTNWETISKKIDVITRAMNPVYTPYIQGIYNDEFKQLLWLIPNELSSGTLNQILTLDLDDNGAWGSISLEATCFGSIQSVSSVTWDTLSFGTWDTWDWDEWDRFVNVSNYLSTVVPDINGDVFYLFQSETDDSNSYTRSFVLGSDLKNQKGINTFKRLLKAEAFFRADTTGGINMQVKRDLEQSWQDPQSLVAESLVKTGYDMTVIEFYFDYLARHFLFKFSGENRFRFLGVLLYFDSNYGGRF